MEAGILVVDDEKEIADLIALYLRNENYRVAVCYNGTDALRRMREGGIDLAVLDVMLPDMSGFTLCRKIREEYTWPIIMLTAKEEEIDKITGLTLGADDYMTKPFRPLELVARVKAQLRRYFNYSGKEGKGETENENILFHSGLVLNVETHECFLNEKPLSLTRTEFSILTTLCREKGKVVSSEKLFHEIWGDEYYSRANNTITVHIRHLREKMNDSIDHPKYIKTVWGCGYKIDSE